MVKGLFICLINLFLFFPGYSQTDSMRTTPADTALKSEAPLMAQHNPETKTVPGKKERVYKLKPAIDIPIVAIGTGWSLYAFTKIYVKPVPTSSDILGLKKENVNAFDRGLMHPFNKSLDQASYYPFYAAMPLPLIFFLTGKETRSDFAQLTFLYWEAMSITGFFGSGAVYFVDRYRPYAYYHDDNGAIDQQASTKVIKNSFYAGHVETVAVPTFFIAKVFADYHPDSKIKWVFYGFASVATGATAYMRLKGGMHFASDVLLGAATGALAGILVPQSHRNRLFKNHNLSVLPFTDGEARGLSFIYKLR